MRIWNLHKLKDELRQGPLAPKDAFLYLLIYNGLFALAAIPFFESNKFDVIIGVISALFIVVGTVYIYHANGGRNGVHLLDRYLSLGFVLTIRLVVCVLIPTYLLYLIVLSAVSELAEETIAIDVAIFAAFEAVFYLLLGKHISDLRRLPAHQQSPADEEFQIFEL